MAQNRSSAVMQQRSEPHESLDDFPTPPWATRALCEQLKLLGFDLPRQSVWEPACNRGYMARVLGEYLRLRMRPIFTIMAILSKTMFWTF